MEPFRESSKLGWKVRVTEEECGCRDKKKNKIGGKIPFHAFFSYICFALYSGKGINF